MLTAGDDYPLHQRPEPIAFAGTDRNFYDRYFFNGQAADGSLFFAAALGVYPHLNLLDAAVTVMDGEGSRSVFASRILHHERMATNAGPISIEVVEPLRRLRVRLETTEGLAADMTATGLHFPIEEPRFTRRIHGRTLMDVTRMTQNVRWEGALSIDGKSVRVDGFLGTRDRSWGVRPIGAADPQGLAPPVAPQFFWLWAPLHFGTHSLYAHTNDDGEGAPWNRSAVLVDHDDGSETRLTDVAFALELEPGTRRAHAARITGQMAGKGPVEARLSGDRHFQMSAIGYGHPTRGHGSFHGELSVTSERKAFSDIDPALPANAHVQTLASATLALPDGATLAGRGVLEQLMIGPHRPTGLKELFDLG